jgi:predicted ester cyclase
MSADSKAHVRRSIEDGWNAKNPAVFDGRIAPEFVSHTPSGDFNGPEGYRQLYQTFVTAFPDCQFTIEDIIAEGDMVSLSYTFAGTNTGPLQDVPPTGRRVSVRGVSVSRIVDGKSVQERVLWDNLDLMQQLGLAS